MNAQALEVIAPGRRELVLSPVMDLELAKSRMEQFQQFVQYYLEPSTDGGMDGGDYGPIPGAGKKKVLLKSGADKLCELYGLYDEYEIEAQENFETKLFYYKITCILKSRRDDSVVGTGVGSCSTYESKYRWRDEQRKCPKCDSPAIIKGKEEYGGGWLCFAKKGGCGAKFKDGDTAIEGQKIGRMENPDIMDTVNTVLKMAKKRAKIDAVIGVTRSSGIFTQDLEDVPMPPAKPPVAVTTEDIPIGSPVTKTAAAEHSKGLVSTPPKAPNKTAEAMRDNPPPPMPPVEELAAQAEANMSAKEATLPQDHIEQGQAVNFAKNFKDALKPQLRKRASDIEHDWLKKQGIVDGDGNGTAKAILKQNFYEVREAAIQYAAEYQG